MVLPGDAPSLVKNPPPWKSSLCLPSFFHLDTSYIPFSSFSLASSRLDSARRFRDFLFFFLLLSLLFSFPPLPYIWRKEKDVSDGFNLVQARSHVSIESVRFSGKLDDSRSRGFNRLPFVPARRGAGFIKRSSSSDNVLYFLSRLQR